MVSDGPALPPCPFCGHEHGPRVLKCPETDMVLPLQGRILGDKFELARELGKGGMATVYLATNTLVDRPVAIKLIRPEVVKEPDLVARFRSEAKAAGRIGHPNVCDILDFGTSVVGPYIVMEYLQGRNLGQLLAIEGSLPVARAVSIVRDALAGLHAAHERGVIHRDLKPENIFLHNGAQGQTVVKLMDFGVAKFTDGTAEIETGRGALLGTPEYMAPEQFQGAELVEPRTDVWAIGAILYRTLTGEHAFRGPTVAATLFRTTQEKQRPMREIDPRIPPRLEAIVERCLQKAPEARYANIVELDHELRGVLEDLNEPDVAPALGVEHDAEDRAHAIAVGPPSLSEVVDAVAAESLATDLQSALERPPLGGRVGESPVRDSAPTLSKESSAKLNDLRSASAPPVLPPPKAPGFDDEEAIETAERTDADAVPDPIEDATTGIANVEPEEDEPPTRVVADAPSSSTPVSSTGLVAVAVVLALLGIGAWALIRDGEPQGESDKIAVLPEDPTPPASGPMPPPTSVAPKHDTPPSVEAASADVPADGDAAGSTGDDMVDDPPPADDEVIEIFDDDTDSADANATDDGSGDAAPSAPASNAKNQPRRRPQKKDEQDVPPPQGTAVAFGFISPIAAAPRTDQSGARRYCEGLAKSRHLGVRGWKLAYPALAKRFSKVRQMKVGRYWTSARHRGRARVIEFPTARSASKKVSRKFRPLCVARWPQ